MKISISNNWLSNVHASEIPTDALHLGDLGIAKDTTRLRMDSGRGTGHLGTGTYFLSDDAMNLHLEKSSGSRWTKADRPCKYLNPSGLNLFKPLDGMMLHKVLKNVLRLSELTVEGDTYWHSKEAAQICNFIKTNIELHYRSFERALEQECERELSVTDSEIRTVPTRIMQGLGYDGIDVRHTKLDNMDYGSVVYAKR